MRYEFVVSVSQVIRRTDETGAMKYETGFNSTIPCTNFQDAVSVKDAILNKGSAVSKRKAEVCVKFWKDRGAVLVPADQLEDLMSSIVGERIEFKDWDKPLKAV